jgi:DNA-binding transcriptional MerR regulator
MAENMDPKKTEPQQKTKALEDYINKQLAAGMKPKELYEHLLEKKVPANTVRELIELALKQPPPSPAPPASDPKTERRQKITNYIQAQLDAGKKPQEILTILVDKKVSREEAIGLIRQVAKPSAPTTAQPQAEGSVSPDLPASSIITPQARQDSLVAFVAAQIDQGVELKAIVDQLETEGMPRNQAIDLVMDFNQKQQAELADPTLANRAELAIKGRNRMLIGLAALVGGGLITMASYSTTEPGGTYILFFGPMIYGVIAAVSGLIQWLRNM